MTFDNTVSIQTDPIDFKHGYIRVLLLEEEERTYEI